MRYAKFDVATESGCYPVFIGGNILGHMSEFLKGITNRILVLTDDVVSNLHLAQLMKGLNESGIEIITKILPSGERFKTLETAEMLYQFLVDNVASRSDGILALGGGVVGDIAGFVASTFKRGMKLIQTPTTLLAQVDSSLGGKTGVNLVSGKNLVGTFYQPHTIVVDVRTLNTLSDDDYVSGLAEVIKYAVIMDKELIDILRDNKKGILLREQDTIAPIIERCLRNKARIVIEDEKEEGGKREILNFGHTIGHAIETVSKHHVSHGYVVAMGMVKEAHLAVRMGQLDDRSLESLISLLSMFGLPAEIPSSIDVRELEAAMKQDKKVRQGKIMLPVLVGLGRAQMKTIDSSFKLL